MLADVASLAVGARFLIRLPAFPPSPRRPGEARATLRRRLESREAALIGLLRRAVYGYPLSPYRELLRIAGCELGDAERLVRQEGVEGALSGLRQQGVFLSVQEFKGRQPAIRGSASVEVSPQRLRNPFATLHVAARTGGSRGAGTPLLFDLAFIRGCGVNTSLALEARGGARWQKANWESPGAGARFRLLKLSSFGAPPRRWFTPVDPHDPSLDPVFRWSERAMRLGSRLAGVTLPPSTFAPFSDPLPVARWIAEVLGQGETPIMIGFASSVVRLCEASLTAGIDLRGAQFTLIGEPTTEARLRSIRRAGAIAVPRYGTIETGPIGYGCLAPEAADDVHLMHDLQAVIQAGPSDVPVASSAATALPSSALFLTALHAAAPFVLLNVSMGDQATLVRRQCGCPMEQLGWPTHLHTVRSYEKLTAGGMTFLDTDVIRILEEELPARFGGIPTDYQLLEQESSSGQPALRLLVHPRLGPLDAQAIREALLTSLGSGSPIAQVMVTFWRDAGFLTVERREPLATHSGKILHLAQRGSLAPPVMSPTQ